MDDTLPLTLALSPQTGRGNHSLSRAWERVGVRVDVYILRNVTYFYESQ